METVSDRQNQKIGNILVISLVLAGVFGVIILINSLVHAAADDNAALVAAGGWQTVFTETFESGIPVGWTVSDGNGATNGEYYWATTTVTASEGTTSVWATGGGGDGSSLVPGTDDYPNNALSTMIQKTPVDLTGTVEARLTFDYWLDTESGLDVLQVWGSTDGTTFTALNTSSGNSSGWQTATVDLTQYAGETQVWIGFFFSSNASNVGKGVFIDNVNLESLTLSTVYMPLVRLDPTPTPVPTPTPLPYYYFDDFSDSSSGWPIVDNTFNPQDCFKWFYENGEYKVNICDDRTDVKTSPLVELPIGDYTIEADARFRYNGGWWTSYGIIFDGKDDPDPSKPDLGDYYMVWVLWGGSNQFKWKILRDVPGAQEDVTNWRDLNSAYFNYGDNGLGWNHWKIERTSSRIKVYVNDRLLADVAEPRPTTNYQVMFGVYAATFETGRVEVSFDNLRVLDDGNGQAAQPAGAASFFFSGDFDLEESLPQDSE